MRVAVLGIGLMGLPMARRLCEAGHAVQAWNRTTEKARRLLPFGAAIRATALYPSLRAFLAAMVTPRRVWCEPRSEPGLPSN